jgi:hypothetical protein
MEPRYQVLRIIYKIVKDETNPLQYPVSFREIILRYAAGWESVEQHLLDLQQEELIIIRQFDRPVAMITEKGIQYSMVSLPEVD